MEKTKIAEKQRKKMSRTIIQICRIFNNFKLNQSEPEMLIELAI